jgi:hypothetical protein
MEITHLSIRQLLQYAILKKSLKLHHHLFLKIIPKLSTKDQVIQHTRKIAYIMILKISKLRIKSKVLKLLTQSLKNLPIKIKNLNQIFSRKIYEIFRERL